MSTDKQSDEIEMEEIEALDEDIGLDSFLDDMETEDKKKLIEQSARRRIEDLHEERRLREQLNDDYPDDLD
jgi:hypothetical protein